MIRHLVSDKTADEQYRLFVIRIDMFIEIVSNDLKSVSFEEWYSLFYKIFEKCQNSDRETLHTKCIEYINVKCQHLTYKVMSMLCDVLLYFSKICPRARETLDRILKYTKQRSITLMELCLTEIKKHPHLIKQIPDENLKQVQYRIKKYYFH